MTGLSTRTFFPILCVFLLSALTGCAGSPRTAYEPGPPELALPASQTGAFAEIEAIVRSRQGERISGFRLLDRNVDGLRSRLVLIDSAQSSIDAQYYLWYGDAAGRLLISHLLDAADRGVRVRLLVDDLNTLLQDAGTVKLRDPVAAWVDAHPNIELRLFNPWTRRDLGARMGEAVTNFKRINQRMHNKALIVDNRAAIVGGRNIGDEYMGLSAGFNFHDLDVLGIGPIARQVSIVFDDYWNSRWAMPVSLLDIPVSPKEQDAGRELLRTRLRQDRSLAEFPLERASWSEEVRTLPDRLVPGTSVVHADHPTAEGFEQLMLEEIRGLIESARSELLIENAYIIPVDRSIAMLRELNERGVTVRVLTNSLASHDVPAVNSHYRRWRKPILESGAELYELRHDAQIQNSVVDSPPTRGGFVGLHSKAMVVDRRYVYVGSMNYDPRSAAINTEMGAFIDSPELADALVKLIDRDMRPTNSWRVELDAAGRLRWRNDAEVVKRQPARNFWQRVEDFVFRLFPKEYY